MKKTLIALVALAGVAAAADTQLWGLSSDVTTGGYLFDASTGLFTDDTDIEGTLLNETDGAGRIQTNISFTLNLTDAMTITDTTTLLNMDMAGDVGLVLTSTGITTTWNGGTGSRVSVGYADLAADTSSFFGNDGDKYITLTMVETYGSGVQLYSNTTKHLNDGGLKGSGNTALTSVYVNSAYVAGVQFSPGWTNEAGFMAKNAVLDAVAQTQLLPEPATATLSLLALAGLAARRRRR